MAVAVDVHKRDTELLADWNSEGDDVGRDNAMDVVAAASVQSMIATGPRRGCKVMRLGNDPHSWRGEFVLGRRCAMVEGFNVHANTAIKADDRDGREHLLRYIARPPLSDERLSQMEDGRVAVRLKKAWRDETTHVAFTPVEFMEKLAALVPRPRANLVRYHGVFAPAAGDRRRIVPKVASSGARAKDGDADGCCADAHPSLRKQRWAELMKRGFQGGCTGVLALSESYDDCGDCIEDGRHSEDPLVPGAGNNSAHVPSGASTANAGSVLGFGP